MPYDLGHCGGKVQSSVIRNMAAELLRMVIKPVESCSKVVQGLFDDHMSLMRVAGCKMGSEGYSKDGLT
jgi:hypothetical protein